MGLKIYKNRNTGEIKETLKTLNTEEWQRLITAPNQKFMEISNAERGVSKIKDSEKMLKARARNHSRDVLGDDNIQTNLGMGSKEAVSRNFLNEKGLKRKKIDDI
jgi:hypothetical protein